MVFRTRAWMAGLRFACGFACRCVCSARHPSMIPPMSARFSPEDNCPFRCTPATTSQALACLIRFFERASNAATSAGVRLRVV